MGVKMFDLADEDLWLMGLHSQWQRKSAREILRRKYCQQKTMQGKPCHASRVL